VKIIYLDMLNDSLQINGNFLKSIDNK